MRAGHAMVDTEEKHTKYLHDAEASGEAHPWGDQPGNVMFTQNVVEGGCSGNQEEKGKKYLTEKGLVFKDVEWSWFIVRIS